MSSEMHIKKILNWYPATWYRSFRLRNKASCFIFKPIMPISDWLWEVESREIDVFWGYLIQICFLLGHSKDLPKDQCYTFKQIGSRLQYQCSICGRILSRKQRILSHLQSMHNRSKYCSCQINTVSWKVGGFLAYVYSTQSLLLG